MAPVEQEQAPQGLRGEDLDAEQAVELPDREALSVVDPRPGGPFILPPPFLDPSPFPSHPVLPVEPLEPE